MSKKDYTFIIIIGLIVAITIIAGTASFLLSKDSSQSNIEDQRFEIEKEEYLETRGDTYFYTITDKYTNLQYLFIETSEGVTIIPIS